MPNRLIRLFRDLTGRSDRDLLQHVADQLDVTLEAVAVTRALAGGEVAADDARLELEQLERRGDDARRALIAELAVTLTTPVDREDLFRLSRSIDDILDNLRDLAREFDLYEVAAEPLLTDPLAGIEMGVVGLREAVGSLVDEPDAAGIVAAMAKKNEVRVSYQQSMAALLTSPEPLDRGDLARRELLRRVDVCGLRLGEAADALSDGAIKRSL